MKRKDRLESGQSSATFWTDRGTLIRWMIFHTIKGLSSYRRTSWYWMLQTYRWKNATRKFYRRLVLSLPTVSNADGWKDDVFFAAQTKKLNKSEELKKLGIEFATILPYSPPKDQKMGRWRIRVLHEFKII